MLSGSTSLTWKLDAVFVNCAGLALKFLVKPVKILSFFAKNFFPFPIDLWFFLRKSKIYCKKIIGTDFSNSFNFVRFLAYIRLENYLNKTKSHFKSFQYVSLVVSQCASIRSLQRAAPNDGLYNLLLQIFAHYFWRELSSFVKCVLGHCNSDLNLWCTSPMHLVSKWKLFYQIFFIFLTKNSDSLKNFFQENLFLQFWKNSYIALKSISINQYYKWILC